ncbi:hypothetical protein [Lelliottia sp.]|uniref:hypothetical protein n=1 Tax=Lelliottia sp. TaxID=1898429 RepID=UPI00388DAAF7
MRSSCLAEWGSTTEPQRGSGAEGGHRPARFSGYGHCDYLARDYRTGLFSYRE